MNRMNGVNLKSIVLIEFLILALIALFSIDLLPRNYDEFQGICIRTWEKDPKQFDICMEPYYRQTSLDKYIIGTGVVSLGIIPGYFLIKKKR